MNFLSCSDFSECINLSHLQMVLQVRFYVWDVLWHEKNQTLDAKNPSYLALAVQSIHGSCRTENLQK